jgi:hypothetical protein
VTSTESKFIQAAGVYESKSNTINALGRVARDPDFRDGRTPTWLSMADVPQPYDNYRAHTFPWNRIMAVVFQSAVGAVQRNGNNACQHCRNQSGPFASCRQLRRDKDTFRFNHACVNCVFHGSSRVASGNPFRCSLME